MEGVGRTVENTDPGSTKWPVPSKPVPVPLLLLEVLLLAALLRLLLPRNPPLPGPQPHAPVVLSCRCQDPKALLQCFLKLKTPANDPLALWHSLPSSIVVRNCRSYAHFRRPIRHGEEKSIRHRRKAQCKGMKSRVSSSVWPFRVGPHGRADRARLIASSKPEEQQLQE